MSYLSVRSHAPEVDLGALLVALEFCPRVLLMQLPIVTSWGFNGGAIDDVLQVDLRVGSYW